MKILVIIPAFNESENIVDVINDCRQHLPNADIVVINDGSMDNTSSIAQSHGVRVIDHIFNLGIGGAVQTGFMVADREGYEVAIQFDGDGQHLAQEIEKILMPMDSGADIVIGSRFLDESGYRMPFFRKIGARVFSFVISIICGNKITDTTSGFRAYGKKAIELFSSSYPEDYPEVEALILAYKKRLNMKEIPVKMKLRPKGKSSITPLRAVYYMIKVLLAVFVDLLKK
jgi:glycosyltransferase involved in cell wall biosynthesis